MFATDPRNLDEIMDAGCWRYKYEKTNKKLQDAQARTVKLVDDIVSMRFKEMLEH